MVDDSISPLAVAVQPSIVRAPGLLLVHHAAAALLVAHALAHAPHLHYLPWMTVVELNTVVLIARRHFQWKWLDGLFYATWIALRVCEPRTRTRAPAHREPARNPTLPRAGWFPLVPLYFTFRTREPWPEPHAQLRRALVLVSSYGLALLQLAWSRNTLGPVLARWRTRGSAAPSRGGWL